jgi:small-conductance mechanosensitive channel
VQSARKSRSLAERWAVWNAQTSRYKLLRQAVDQARADIKNLTAEHNQLEAQADAVLAAAKAESAAPSSAGSGGATDHASRLASLRERSAERQLLSLYDDRIQTEERLADVYDKWSAQVLLQHRIVLHLMLQSGALIAFILICVLLADSYLQRLTLGAVADAGAGAASDRRRLLTLRSILQLGVQLVGAGFILLVVFGVPRQISTIVGLATAGLTVVMQDFIIAFFGWFVLMGKNGIRVGDWVEINGVGGEVTEVGLFRTTMLETGNWTDKGHPTGRRVTFINSFAIRGQFFNFSTAGQWMWDEIAVTVPSTMDSTVLAQSIHDAVLEETKKDVGVAEQEWQRGTRNDGLSQFTAEPTVNLRPSGAGVDVLVRYVTRASDRYEMRNRLFQRVLDVLRKPEPAAETGAAGPA